MARSLCYGYTGDDVLQAQRDMQSIGYYVGGPLDGIFGPLMDSEVRRLQLDNGMAGDGWYGPNTRAVVAAKQQQAAATTVTRPKKKKKKANSNEKEMAYWHGYEFVVSPSLVRSITDLTVKTSCETETKKSDEDGYYDRGIAYRKGANPSDVSFVVHYNAFMGCDVRNEVYGLLLTAQDGVSDNLYIGGKRIISYQFMLTEANLQKVEIARNSKWKSAELVLTMKQSTWN